MNPSLDAKPLTHLGDQEHPGVFAGKNMGGFHLLREIASGGMASVYLAYKTGPGGFGQVAAIKVVHPHLARERDFVEMFLDEARIAATINHPNVARVIDFGRAEGTYYLAMEYLMGETWGEVQRRILDRALRDDLTHLPLLIAHVLERACEGLHAAHEAKDPAGHALQVVHRDVSPQNLFVLYDGTVRVLDFGIASARERLHTTRHGTVKGRFSYMSPEQMNAQSLDRRSDVWSLGVILWEGLARRRLFRRDTEAETIVAVTNEPLPPFPSEVGPIPDVLAQIAVRALARDPEKRFDTAREMGVELARFISRRSPAPEVEVSTRMARLFREDIASKQRQLQEAAENAALSVPPAVLPDDSTDLDTVPPKRHRELKGELKEAAASVVVQKPQDPLVRPRWRSLAFVWLALALAVGYFLFGSPKGEQNIARNNAESSQALAAQEQSRQLPSQEDPSGPGEQAEQAANAEPAPQPVLAPPTDEQANPVTARRGILDVTAPGCWADVYLGAQKLGTTPGRFRLPGGRYVLRLEVLGKGPGILRGAEITPGASTRLRVPCK